MRKILAILFTATLLLVSIALLLDPTIRYPYIGVSLERDLNALDGSDPMTVMLSVESGTELISEESLSEEPSIQDEYTLLMILREEFKAQKQSATVTYDVEEMESEQWAWQEVKLNELKAQTKVSPRGIAKTPQLEFSQESVMASARVWNPLLTSFWPKLPEGLQRAGKGTWQEQFSYEEPNPIDGKSTRINYNLLYRLDKFINTEQGILANILILGTISEASEVDSEVEVRGTIKGFVLLQPNTGRIYGGEYRIDEQFLIRQPGLPVYRRATYQGARFWRPMFYKMSQEKLDALESQDGSL